MKKLPEAFYSLYTLAQPSFELFKPLCGNTLSYLIRFLYICTAPEGIRDRIKTTNI